MKRGMIELTRLLNAYFAEHNIDPSGFTLGMKFKDAEAACRFEIALKRELTPMTMDYSKELPGDGSFELNGLKVEIESPFRRPRA